jgi:hypothetical protein
MAASYCVAMLRPGVRAELLSLRYRVPQDLIMIQNARYNQDLVPTISAEQVRVWRSRKQQIFDGFAFYQVAQKSVSTASHAQSALKIACASSNLFGLLALPVRFPLVGGEAHDEMPQLILSDTVCGSLVRILTLPGV